MKLSIITINLNNISGLRKTIESVLSQKFTDFEFIIVDGESSDGSVSLIHSFSDKIDCIITEPDKGIYNAMNKGIYFSKGEYCFFLNSGDYFVNERVLEVVFANNCKQDVVFGNLLVYFDNRFIGKSIGKDIITFIDVYCSLIKHQASFIRRSLFDDYGCYNEELKIVSDWEFFLKSVGLGGASYRYLDVDIACFDNNGISNNNPNLVDKEKKIVIGKYIPVRMQQDYELLAESQKFKIVLDYRISKFLLRLITKGTKIFKFLVRGE